MNILIPMAGNGQRFVDAGYEEPKPFIDVLGQPMIERVVENLGGSSAGNFIFVVRDYKAFCRMREITRDWNNYEILIAEELTAGAACTALLAREFIENNDPLLIANSDQIISGTVTMPSDDAFIDGEIFTFDAENPKWSYAAVDDKGRVWGVAEKQPISRRATCGLYWWKRGVDFVRAADRMIAKNIRVNNEFYIAPVFNEAIARGAIIHELPAEFMWGLGTPEDLRRYVAAHS